MLKNYFLIALRNLFRNKLFSAVNIFGLAIGLACCFIILLHVRSELSFDRFHEKGDNIYRLVLHRFYPDTQVDYALSPHSMGPLLLQEMPEIKSYCRLFKGQGEATITYEDKSFTERHIMLADSNFFDMFSISLLSGNPDRVLRNPLELIVTESTAKRYFGNEDPLGKTINGPVGELQIIGVCEDVPDNSHFYFDFLGSLNGLPFLLQPSYVTFSVYTYLEIDNRQQSHQVEAKIPGLLELYAAGDIQNRMGVSYTDYVAAGNGYEYFLQPLTSIHLHSHLNNELDVNGNINYIIIFISVAIFILIIASINFINLSTARSSERAKEVGIRKVVGSERSSLIRQFMTESVLITFISLVFAILIVEVTLPTFNRIAGTQLAFDYSDKYLLPVIIGFGLIVGLLSGSYPAMVLSAFKPASILKGKFSTSKKGVFTRKGLVVFQFFISISLISFTLVVFNQLRYMQNKNLGFNKENVLVLRGFMPDETRETLKQELERIPEVTGTTASNTQITGGFYFGFMIQAEEYGSEVITTRAMVVDNDFIETMGLKVIDGRGFSKDFNDSLSLIINETAAHEFGMSEAVGAKIIEPVDTGGGSVIREYTIIGIIEDFHYNSLHDDLNSFVLQSTTGPNGGTQFIYVKTATDNMPDLINQIEAKWNDLVPQQQFSYFFLEDYINNMYQGDRASGRLFSIFTLLAIIIACVGLFGLASFSTQQRIKEIGIRKVMGSSISKIVLLLSTDFVKLIIGAFLISIPIGILSMKFWLKNFSFSTKISLMIFVYAGLLSLLIALITISYHTIRSASANPSDILRHE